VYQNLRAWESLWIAGEPVAATGYRDYEAPARALQMNSIAGGRGPNPDLDAAIKTALEWHADRSSLLPVTMLFPYRKVIADLALKWRLPTVYTEVTGSWLAASCRMRRRSRGVTPGCILH